MYTEDYVHLEKDDLVKVACQLRLEARGGLYDAEGHAESLKIAKEQSLAAVSAARRLPRAMLLRL